MFEMNVDNDECENCIKNVNAHNLYFNLVKIFITQFNLKEIILL